MHVSPLPPFRDMEHFEHLIMELAFLAMFELARLIWVSFSRMMDSRSGVR